MANIFRKERSDGKVFRCASGKNWPRKIDEVQFGWNFRPSFPLPPPKNLKLVGVSFSIKPISRFSRQRSRGKPIRVSGNRATPSPGIQPDVQSPRVHPLQLFPPTPESGLGSRAAADLRPQRKFETEYFVGWKRVGTEREKKIEGGPGERITGKGGSGTGEGRRLWRLRAVMVWGEKREI